MRTLGELVDRLSVTNLKLWFVQDEFHRASREGRGVDKVTVNRSVSLNLERNRLMTEIDECFQRGLETGKTDVDARVKLT